MECTEHFALSRLPGHSFAPSLRPLPLAVTRSLSAGTHALLQPHGSTSGKTRDGKRGRSSRRATGRREGGLRFGTTMIIEQGGGQATSRSRVLGQRLRVVGTVVVAAVG